jgi:hypothetical protein
MLFWAKSEKLLIDNKATLRRWVVIGQGYRVYELGTNIRQTQSSTQKHGV